MPLWLEELLRRLRAADGVRRDPLTNDQHAVVS
jgi:hypothetical protein